MNKEEIRKIIQDFKQNKLKETINHLLTQQAINAVTLTREQVKEYYNTDEVYDEALVQLLEEAGYFNTLEKENNQGVRIEFKSLDEMKELHKNLGIRIKLEEGK